MNVSGDIFWEKLNSTIDRTSWSSNSSSENGTYVSDEAPLDIILKIKPMIDILLFVALILIMLCMGFEIRKEELLHHIRRPIGISIGMFSQFVFLPLSAFILLKCFSIKGLYATGVLLMSCCPGGAFSNIMAYSCDGDLSLSVAMTSLSTLAAMGMMPLNLWMYGRIFRTEGLVIPYVKFALSLVCITSPVAVGMLFRWKAPRIAAIVAKPGLLISGLLIITYIVFDFVTSPNMFTNVPGKLYIIVMGLPLIGLSLGYGLALMFKQNTGVCKTIAIECSVQNIPTALAIISMSFSAKLQKDIVPIPYMYSFAMTSTGFILCSLYQVYKKCGSQKTPTKQLIEKETKKGQGILMCQGNEAFEPMLKPSWKVMPTVLHFPDVSV